jgi:hypothetical protein
LNQKEFKLGIDIVFMKEILLISIVFLTLTGILGLFGGAVIAQTNSVTDTNNMTGTVTDNMTGTDSVNTTESEEEVGMISRRAD